MISFKIYVNDEDYLSSINTHICDFVSVGVWAYLREFHGSDNEIEHVWEVKIDKKDIEILLSSLQKLKRNGMVNSFSAC